MKKMHSLTRNHSIRKDRRLIVAPRFLCARDYGSYANHVQYSIEDFYFLNQFILENLTTTIMASSSSPRNKGHDQLACGWCCWLGEKVALGNKRERKMREEEHWFFTLVAIFTISLSCQWSRKGEKKKHQVSVFASGHSSTCLWSTLLKKSSVKHVRIFLSMLLRT